MVMRRFYKRDTVLIEQISDADGQLN